MPYIPVEEHLPGITGLLEYRKDTAQPIRVVGARHYNAIVEDELTHSWWYQATGEAAAGALKGSKLKVLPYEQATLASWLSRYPTSLILQPDNHYLGGYKDLKNYDRLQAVDRDSSIINKDALQRKSWIVGIEIDKKAKAYDWRQLNKVHLRNDQVGQTPLLLTVEKDSLSYHAWNRRVGNQVLSFKFDSNNQLTDLETNSRWDNSGTCVSGPHKGRILTKIQAYQEYWHSWKQFHPHTLLL